MQGEDEMKKLLITIICLIALIMPSRLVMAENLAIQTDIDVIVKYAEENPDNSVELGSGHPIILQDGTEVTFMTDREEDQDIRAAVILITEGEQGYGYVLESTEPYGNSRYALYVLFYREGKEAVPEGTVIMSITQPDGCDGAEVYRFSGGSDRPVRVEVQISGSRCSAALTESGYLAWVDPKQQEEDTEGGKDQEEDKETGNTGAEEDAADPETAEDSGHTEDAGTSSGQTEKQETGQTTSEQAEEVQTGDRTDVRFWIVLGAAAAVMFLGVRRKSDRPMIR